MTHHQNDGSKLIRVLLAVVFVFSLSTATLSQKGQAAVPNLSGTWELDVKKSYYAPDTPLSSCTLVIEHNDPTVKLNWTIVWGGETKTYEETLFTDRRTEENDQAGVSGRGFNNGSIRSRTFWQKRTLIRQYIFGVSLDRNTLIMDKTKYSLSADAKDLTIMTVLQPKSLIPEPTAGPQSTVRSFSAVEQRQVFHRK